MPELTEEIIAQLKREHGSNLRAVDTPSGTLVFRQPSVAEWNSYTDVLIGDKGRHSAAARELQSACVCWPNADAWRQALVHSPALLNNAFGQAMNELAGTEDELTPRKL